MAGERQNALVQGVDDPFLLREKAIFQLRWRGDPVVAGRMMPAAPLGIFACVMHGAAVQFGQEMR